jgi:hypothetical protein
MEYSLVYIGQYVSKIVNQIKRSIVVLLLSMTTFLKVSHDLTSKLSFLKIHSIQAIPYIYSDFHQTVDSATFYCIRKTASVQFSEKNCVIFLSLSDLIRPERASPTTE